MSSIPAQNIDHFTNLIVDQDDPILAKMRRLKLQHLCSPNSEDALTWNAFRTLRRLDNALWFPRLFAAAFGPQARFGPQEMLDIVLWRKLPRPPAVRKYHEEGPSEVDILIETGHAVWIIEAKYTSDIALRVKYDPTRDQIIRNVDVGSYYAGERDFYFSLLILDQTHCPAGAKLVGQYAAGREWIPARLPHRPDGLSNLKGISLLRWSDVASVLRHCAFAATTECDRNFAKRAADWLTTRIAGAA